MEMTQFISHTAKCLTYLRIPAKAKASKQAAARHENSSLSHHRQLPSAQAWHHEVSLSLQALFAKRGLLLGMADLIRSIPTPEHLQPPI